MEHEHFTLRNREDSTQHGYIQVGRFGEKACLFSSGGFSFLGVIARIITESEKGGRSYLGK